MRNIWEKAHGLDLFNADDHNGDHHPRSSKVAVRERWSRRRNGPLPDSLQNRVSGAHELAGRPGCWSDSELEKVRARFGNPSAADERRRIDRVPGIGAQAIADLDL
jgi:hypothetical protein